MERRATPVKNSNVRTFRTTILLVITVVTLAVFFWTGSTIVKLVEAEALSQARTYTDLIVAARAWNARAGGVYVRLSDEFQPNPYLIALGVEPNVTLEDGSVLTLRNPAAMTREIGEQLDLSDGRSGFKLTSLQEVNPANAPDAWEREGLEELEAGALEVWTVAEAEDGTSVFRYMRPLFVQSACLTCHGGTGYEVDDIRGALSVTLPYEATTSSLESTRTTLIVICAAVLMGLWTSTWMASRALSIRLADANSQLEYAANTDALTGLCNRGFAMHRLEEEIERAHRSGQRVGVVLADIDFFKNINDTFGHAAGDATLRALARTFETGVRAYDVVCRIGGEEFLVIAPDIDDEGLFDLAERLRADVASAVIAEAGDTTLTVSAGVACTDPARPLETIDALIARADTAMYAAKESGRNRVVRG